MNTTNQEQNKDKQFFNFALALTVVIAIAVIVLNQKVLPRPDVLPTWTYFLPKLNALINGTCSLLLITSLYFIKKGNVQMHKKLNITTFALSSLFLISYVLFHWMAPETKFPADNPLRTIYLIILISHIILAAGVLPLILLSFYRGLQNQVSLHKKVVRFAYPIWLYVTITGVVVYLMISPFYPINY